MRGPCQYLFQCARHGKCVPHVDAGNRLWSLEYPTVDLLGEQVQERLDSGRVKHTRLHALERQPFGVKCTHIDWERAILGVYSHHDHTTGTVGRHG